MRDLFFMVGPVGLAIYFFYNSDQLNALVSWLEGLLH
jgi:hypothetical protein